MLRICFALLLAFSITSCSKSYDEQVDDLRKYVGSHKIGDDSDVWLVKRNFGLNDRVALIFGYMDDFGFCNEIAQMYMSRYPGDTYACEIAN